MPIIACGLNHKTAPIALREKAVFQSDKLALYLQDLINNENVHEAVLLSTCNRGELYCNTDDPKKMLDWFSRQHAIEYGELKKAWYCYEGQEAIQHMMRVASGLDAMVLGEPQILGQMKEAFSESCAAGSVGPQFNRLFQQIFAVAKEVRTNTAIGACPVSIASAAVNLARHIFPKNLNEATVLLVGAGSTTQLVLRHLKVHSVHKLMIVNRNLTTAEPLAKEYNADIYPLSTLPYALSVADIMITATSSATPIITKAMLTERKNPLYIIDIAVPRDVETSVATLPNITLYSIDDLKTIIQHNLRGREHAAEKAQEVIQQKSQDFILWLQSFHQIATTIRTYRKQIEDLRDTELDKAMRQLQKGDDPAQVLVGFSHAFTNKLLHHPSVQLRQAGVEGRFELLQLAQQLFAIPEPEIL